MPVGTGALLLIEEPYSLRGITSLSPNSNYKVSLFHIWFPLLEVTGSVGGDTQSKQTKLTHAKPFSVTFIHIDLNKRLN